MVHELKVFEDYIPRSAWPHISCPTCLRNSVALETLENAPSGESSRSRSHEAWEPEWETGTFYGSLKCSTPSCSETISIAGEYKVDMREGVAETWDELYDTFYRLRFAMPPLSILNPPAEAPEDVKEAIARASQILWIDPSAAANRLRFAIETLLTACKVRRYIAKNGKRNRLTTHHRIGEFKQKNLNAGEALEAVKWIGNSGSHEDRLTIADVLDCADMLGHALRIIYNREEREMLKRIQSTNRAKGIPRRRKRTEMLADGG
jgi:hypothetical protein